MRRPAVFAALAFGSGIAAAFYAEIGSFVWAAMLAEAAALFFIWKRWGAKKMLLAKVCLFLCIFSMGGGLLQISAEKEDPLAEQAGKTALVTGRVLALSQKDGVLKMTVDTGESRILVSYYGKSAIERLAGRWVEVNGKIELAPVRRNPGCFDYRLYLKSCGIGTVMTASSVKPVSGKPLSYVELVSGIKARFAERLALYMEPDMQAMVMAMLFGDKSSLPEDMYEDFQKNGTAHILAVSGIHVGIVYGFFAFLWRGRRGWVFHLLTLALLLCYMALAEFSPSVVRASVMITIHLGAKVLHRRYDLLSSAAFTFLLMLVINPWQLFHTGFQLSFLAVASLGVILPFAARFYQGILLSSAAIQVGMMPYTAYVFNYVSLGGLVANLPVIFLAGILLPVGIGLLVTSYVSDSLFGLGAELMQQGCRLLVWINSIFYVGGRTSMDVVSPPVFLLAAYYSLLFGGICEKGRILFLRGRRRALMRGALALLLVCGILSAATDDGFAKAKIVFVDVGQGDCIHVRTQEGKNYLIDGGGSTRYDVGKKTLRPYLLKNGVGKIEAAFVTHLHEDHYGGIRSLAKEGMVKRVGIYEGNRVREKEIKSQIDAELLYLHKGQTIRLGEEVYLEILAPPQASDAEYERLAEKQEDENASSLIMKLKYGRLSLLITGDIDQEGERQLLEQLPEEGLKTDILKIAHHGSRYSSCPEFLEAAAPSMAVIQVGKNNFGHPAQSVIENCGQKGIMVYRNDTSGAIGICPGNGDRGISIRKMIE